MIEKVSNSLRPVDLWRKVLSEPTPSYKKLFEEEQDYLRQEISPDDYVLDMCCGDGRNIESLQKITGNVYGIDNDPRAIDAATKRTFGNNLVLGDALHTPFSDTSFDAVIMFDTLINFKEKKIDMLKEMARITKNDGEILISVYSEDAFDSRKEMYEKIGAQTSIRGTTFVFGDNTESEQFTQEELGAMAREANLEVRECKRVEHLAYIVKLQKRKTT